MPTHEHMEHAEHAEHAAHDPFDRRVALTIAIVAAVLASVTVLAHRAHTDTLQLQGEGLGIQTEANSLSNESFDKWAEYQAKKNRQYADIKTRDIIQLLPISKADDEKQQKKLKDLDGSIAKSTKKVAEAMEEAKLFDKKSKDKIKEAAQKMHESHDMHRRADRYDLGELFVEVALVLCSIAILTKRKSFWFTGMGVCVLGACISVSGLLGLFMEDPHGDQHHEQKHDAHPNEKGADHKPEKEKTDNAHH